MAKGRRGRKKERKKEIAKNLSILFNSISQERKRIKKTQTMETNNNQKYI